MATQQKKINRDYPLSPTPELKISQPISLKSVDNEKKSPLILSVEGSGGGSGYFVRGGVDIPITKKLSVGVEKNYGKEEGEKFGGTTYKVGINIPLNKKRK
jgi:hypothetical protein